MSVEEMAAGVERPADYYWFKPKHHGYGAVPKTWQGWVVTLGFTFALGLSTAVVLTALRGSETGVWHFAWVALVLAAVWRFALFARARTDGEWLWRYKGQPYRDMIEEKRRSNAGPG